MTMSKNKRQIKEELKEEFKVAGEDILRTVKKILAEGNARRVIIKSENGESILELPLTLGAVGVILAPVLAAVGLPAGRQGAVAALVTKCTIVVIKNK